MTVPQVVSTRRGTDRPHYNLTTAGAASQEDLLRGLLEKQHAPRRSGRANGAVGASACCGHYGAVNA